MGSRSLDWLTLSLYLALVAIGWLMVFTVGYGDGYPSGFAFFQTVAGKQTIWIGIALMVFLLAYIVDPKFWSTFAFIIYGFTLFLLVLVLIFGTKIKGATSWFALGGFSFQPSELAKFGTCLAMASFLSNFNTDLREIKFQLQALAILAGPVFLILLQPDAGSALVFASFLVVLYRSGFPEYYYLIGGVLIALFIVSLVFPVYHVILGLIGLSLVFLALQFNGSALYWTAGALAFGAFSWPATTLRWLNMEAVLIGNVAALLLLSAIAWVRKKEQLVGLLIVILFIGGDIVMASNYAFNNFLSPHQQDRLNVWFSPASAIQEGLFTTYCNPKWPSAPAAWREKVFWKGL